MRDRRCYHKMVNGYRITFSVKYNEYRIHSNGKIVGRTGSIYDAIEACKLAVKNKTA